MDFSKMTRAAGLEYASMRSHRWALALQALQDAFKLIAAWGCVLILRLECAVLRLILGARQERFEVPGRAAFQIEKDARAARGYPGRTDAAQQLGSGQIYRECGQQDH